MRALVKQADPGALGKASRRFPRLTWATDLMTLVADEQEAAVHFVCVALGIEEVDHG